MPDDYIAAFNLPPGSKTYRSTRHFGTAFIGALLRRRASVIFPPGPYPLTTWRAALRSGVSLAATIAVRVTGGESVTVGKSVRGSFKLATLCERGLARASSFYVARDALSRLSLMHDVDVRPDLAFSGSSKSANTGEKLCISLRYDRAANKQVLLAITTWATEHGMKPTIVTQVKRDSVQHREIASNLGIAHVDWSDSDHSAQMSRVRDAYANAAVVVTDRLHVAILGALAGAAPVALKSHGEPSKIVDALGPLIPVVVLSRDSSELTGGALTAALGNVAQISVGVDSARANLAELEKQVRAAINRSL